MTTPQTISLEEMHRRAQERLGNLVSLDIGITQRMIDDLSRRNINTLEDVRDQFTSISDVVGDVATAKLAEICTLSPQVQVFEGEVLPSDPNDPLTAAYLTMAALGAAYDVMVQTAVKNAIRDGATMCKIRQDNGRWTRGVIMDQVLWEKTNARREKERQRSPGSGKKLLPSTMKLYTDVPLVDQITRHVSAATFAIAGSLFLRIDGREDLEFKRASATSIQLIASPWTVFSTLEKLRPLIESGVMSAEWDLVLDTSI